MHSAVCLFESCCGAGSALYPTLIVIHVYLRLCVFDGNRYSKAIHSNCTVAVSSAPTQAGVSRWPDYYQKPFHLHIYATWTVRTLQAV